MGYGPGSYNGKQDLLEQLRAKRRKRQARLLAFSILATAGLLVLVVLVIGLKSCISGPGAGPQQLDQAQLPPEVQTTAASEAGQIDFRPEPLFTALGSDLLLSANAGMVDGQPSSGLVEKLVAHSISDGKLAWERPVNDILSGMLVSGGNLVVHREDDHGFSAQAFSLADGSPVWDFSIDGAQNISIANDNARLAVAYNLADGYRVAIYDTVKGVKGSGRMLQGANSTMLDVSRMNMRFIGTQLLYTVDRTVGMIDFEQGSAWAETGSTQVIIASPDPANRQVYVLSWGNGADSLVLYVRGFGDGKGKELDRFETTAEWPVMVADDGYLLLACSDRRADGKFDTTVRLFRKDSRDTYVRETLEGVVVEDAMPLASGLFVLGTNRSTGNPDNPASGGQLHLVNAEDGSVTEFEGMRENVEYTIRFGEDRLVLLDNGDIRRIELGDSRAVKVRRAAYPMLRPLFSPDMDVLGVLSTQPESVPGSAGSRMQAVIFR
ncbi:MAG: PQQ-binding-like beta-propeller repeat protein [Planctomycetales bacterium]|nr:PQQ-binding-like beta-propeller repeat protein [bacterium]UNM09833.1 MAG: PQQ-binding-like beta-propeller repeat protein [Planctomycetales bacterium]